MNPSAQTTPDATLDTDAPDTLTPPQATTTRRAWDVLLAGLLLGLAADYLCRVSTWGLNVAVWMGLLAAFFGVLWHRYGVEKRPDVPLLAALVVVFAACFAWRDAELLTFLNFLALLTTGGLLIWRAGGAPVTRLGDVLRGWWHGITDVVTGTAFMVAREAAWGQVAPDRGRATAVGRGLALALPLVLLFGGLFAAADATFARVTSSVVQVDLGNLVGHAVAILCFGWIAAGLLRGLLARASEVAPSMASAPWLRLGTVEVGMMLGALVGVFGLFVGIQAGYLFGGLEFLLREEGLSRAEYARDGFFEMAWAAALLLPVLLLTDVAISAGDEKTRRLYRWLTLVLLVLLGAVMGSALHRMHLYQQAFGPTVLRFYVTCFIGWMAVGFAWFGWTVLRGERTRFAPGVLCWGLLAVLLLNLASPDAYIAHQHLERLEKGQTADVQYLVKELSNDAFAYKLAALRYVNDEMQQLRLREHLAWRADHLERETKDWRSWNWGRTQARQALRDYDGPVALTPAEVERLRTLRDHARQNTD